MSLIAGGIVAGFHILRLLGRLFEISGELGLGVEDVSRDLFWISFGAFFLFLGLSHFEIREYGVLYFDRFLKWEKIESSEWEGDDRLTLTLMVRRRLPFGWRISLGIPSIHKDAVESLLAEHVSSATVDGRNGP